MWEGETADRDFAFLHEGVIISVVRNLVSLQILATVYGLIGTGHESTWKQISVIASIFRENQA